MRTREFEKLKVGSRVTLVLGRKSNEENRVYNPSWEGGWIVKEGLDKGLKEINGRVEDICKDTKSVCVHLDIGGHYYTCKKFLK